MTDDLSDRVRAWRHRLHEHPETGFAEHETSGFVAGTRESLGLDVARGIGGTGVVASLTRGSGSGAIALRADMDGLPIPERGSAPYRSRNDGATCEVTYTHEFEPTVNDPACTATAVRAAVAAVGAARVDPDCLPFMGSEDFGVFARAVPGCFTFLGNGTDPDGGSTPLHSHGYDFNDDVLDAGVSFYTALVRDVLAPSGAA